MLDYKKVKDYIEHKNKIKLTPMQLQILKAIIRGDVIYTARGIGRSILYNGYADYLKDRIAKDTDRSIESTEYDSIFTASMLQEDDIVKGSRLKDTINNLKENFPERFYREFECKFYQ